MADIKEAANDAEETPLDESTVSEHDPHYEPIISLPEMKVKTMEEEEEEVIRLRAKLFRFDSGEDPPEWKERGTGDAKLLRHEDNGTVRMVMRRDKTLKICANHFITPWMELKPNCGSDRAWVWSVPADFADEVPKSELLAIRFANAENAKKWKDKFEDAKKIVLEAQSKRKEELKEDQEQRQVEEAEEVTQKLNTLQVSSAPNEKGDGPEDSPTDDKSSPDSEQATQEENKT